MQTIEYNEGDVMKGITYKQAAKLFRMLAHPGRIHILDELRRAEACVCHLQTVLHRPQAYVSQQLRVLREAGIVTADKDGLNVYYRLSDPQTVQLIEDVLGTPGRPTRLPDCPCPRCQGEYRAETTVELVRPEVA
jgi:DNA-binding transcriptional ArsR family regulator